MTAISELKIWAKCRPQRKQKYHWGVMPRGKLCSSAVIALLCSLPAKQITLTITCVSCASLAKHFQTCGIYLCMNVWYERSCQKSKTCILTEMQHLETNTTIRYDIKLMYLHSKGSLLLAHILLYPIIVANWGSNMHTHTHTQKVDFKHFMRIVSWQVVVSLLVRLRVRAETETEQSRFIVLFNVKSYWETLSLCRSLIEASLPSNF